MNRNEIFFLVANIPACFVLFYLFGLIFSITDTGIFYVLNHFASTMFVFALVTILLDLFVLKALKAFTVTTVLLTLLRSSYSTFLFHIGFRQVPFDETYSDQRIVIYNSATYKYIYNNIYLAYYCP